MSALELYCAAVDSLEAVGLVTDEMSFEDVERVMGELEREADEQPKGDA